MGTGSPGPAIYSRHLPISVGDPGAFNSQAVPVSFK